MGGVFINYRRHPARDAFAVALHERLASRFTSGNVFLDVTSINPGERYPNRLRRHLDRADVVIAIVHSEWVQDLRSGTDWVRWEIEHAFAEGKTIIPLLLAGARMPTAQELPRSIREFAHLQAVGDDLDALLDVIGDPLQRSTAVRQTPRRRWTGPLAITAAAVAFAAAALLVPDDVAIYASGFGTAVLIAVMISVGVVSLARKPINESERLVHDFDPTRYYLWVGVPGGIFLVALTVAVVFSSPVAPQLRPFLIFVTGLATLQLVFLVIRQYRAELDRERDWPARLPEPVRAAPVRRELERLRRKLATGDEQRIRWHVRHLENAADVLSRDANRGRWIWLVSDQPAALTLYAAWAAAIVGMTTTVALVVVLASVAAVTVEAAFRRQRWVRQTLADEVHAQAQRILDKL
ncbi:toll/interleukin-1 receptor domain-containing protein [Lentzea flava]|uniref:TIR domain-containing protein n=1 Tax=Lentzea flava TaxID=103732 RepID=A0ABQ2UVT0_9PSEU|nr:toll/interleukin-1 receptor domain-containing protein [Lentzea flava]MCP2201877.1 TIR domain-containing protein [Lentzea flava]GGU55925.1 hypothetical protein GCM10010178_55390 [Lentzea flava]